MATLARRAAALGWFAVLAVSPGCEARDAAPATPVDLIGAGATFPYPLYRAWFSRYTARTGQRINYLAVGSAEGLRLLERGDVDFGATEAALPPAAPRAPGCERLAVPMVAGSIAIVYNLPSLDGRPPLRLDATTLADIFSARLRRWNAPEIARLNPGVALPALPISIVHRGKGSGTDRAFGEFLASSGRWPVASDGAPAGGWAGGIAAEGNDGVVMEVKVAVGAIGYAELAYARQSRLPVAAIGSPAGFVLPGADALGRYPIVSRTWLLLDPNRVSPAHRGPLAAFVRWAITEGAEDARALEYTPLPGDSIAPFDSALTRFQHARCTAAG